MSELSFAIVYDSPLRLAILRDLLRDFESLYKIKPVLRQMTWMEGRQQLSSGEVGGEILDVCEVGTTWVSALAEREVLRPFSPRDSLSVGGAGAFFEGALRICSHNDVLWAVPWQLDTRLIWYWRDTLAAAGVREQSAFDSPAHIGETLAAIDRSGRPAWVTAMDADIVTLQNAASWVWYGSGNLMEPSGRAVAFDRSEALAAWKAFFGLARFVPPELRGLAARAAEEAFAEHKAAVTVSGSWLPERFAPSAATLWHEHLGAAPMPGWSMLGGTGLALLGQGTHVEESLQLVRFLTSPEAQLRLAQLGNLLPARLAILTDPRLNVDPRFHALSSNVARGRSLPRGEQWAAIEWQLSAVLGAVWQDVLATPEPDLDEILARHLSPLARQLNVTLAA